MRLGSIKESFKKLFNKKTTADAEVTEPQGRRTSDKIGLQRPLVTVTCPCGAKFKVRKPEPTDRIEFSKPTYCRSCIVKLLSKKTGKRGRVV